MVLTYEEQLQLVNSKEHLEVVLSNLRIASGELSQVLAQVEDAKNILAKTLTLNQEAGIEATRISLETSSMRESLKTRLLEIEKRDTTVTYREEQAEHNLRFAKKELEDITLKLNSFKRQHADGVIHHLGIINDLTDKINSLSVVQQKYEEENKEALRKQAKCENEVARLNTEIEAKHEELKNFEAKAGDRIIAIEKQIEEERDKIKNPLELIRRESDLLDIKLSDFAVIKARLTQQYRELNPDKILPIELQ